ANLRLVHPTQDDIPSCVWLMELSMGCHVCIRSQVESWHRHGESSRCAHKHDDFKL
ncbi:hypothetical protein EDD85DRAFT_743634, partial [Armillaria nabsnona]